MQFSDYFFVANAISSASLWEDHSRRNRLEKISEERKPWYFNAFLNLLCNQLLLDFLVDCRFLLEFPKCIFKLSLHCLCCWFSIDMLPLLQVSLWEGCCQGNGLREISGERRPLYLYASLSFSLFFFRILDRV